MCYDFRGHTVLSLVEECNLQSQVQGRVSDHSVFKLKVNTRDLGLKKPETPGIAPNKPLAAQKETTQIQNDLPNKPQKRYRKCNIPDTFMTSTKRVAECPQLIDDIISARQTQEEIDQIYEQFVIMYHKEMSLFMKGVKNTSKSRKFLRYTKCPYWDEELSEASGKFHKAERAFLPPNRLRLSRDQK